MHCPDCLTNASRCIFCGSKVMSRLSDVPRDQVTGAAGVAAASSVESLDARGVERTC